jgi:predicted nucleotide-binding protein
MAQMPIEVLDLLNTNNDALAIAVDEAMRVQNEFRYEVLDRNSSESMKLHVLKDTYTSAFFDALTAKRAEWRGYHPYIISAIDSLLHSDEWSNLFSSRRAKDGFALVTIANVPGVLIPNDKIVAYFLYEFAVHTLSFIVSGRKHHKENRGCIFDFKEQKAGIVDSMKAGALCDECKQWFATNGPQLSPAQLRAIDALLARCAELMAQTVSPSTKSKPRMFVGSSTEGLEIARAIQSELEHDFAVEIWNQNTIFGLGTATIEALEEAVLAYDFAIFVFTPDDQLMKRGNETSIPRDNVIFEAGLFIGKLTRFRAFIIHPRGVSIQLPSDLSGVTTATYETGAGSIDAAIGPACRKVRIAVKNWLTRQ